MKRESAFGRTAPGGVTALLALGLMASTAQAGGFAVREQSASLLGSAFAGAAAGGDLSSSFWNPAAFGIAKDGFSSESHSSILIPNSELSNGKLTSGNNDVTGLVGGANSTEIDKLGALSASYAAYRINDKLVLGLSVNSPFGLTTDPKDNNWVGRLHGREAQMLSFNATPTLAYEIAPGVQIAAGLQVEYLRLKLWFASSPVNGASTSIKVTDEASIGGTAGILLNPVEGTRIGIGYRSSISHDLSGNLNGPSGLVIPVSATLDTPDMVTASISQDVMPGLRVLGTVEWTKWSNIDNIPINGTGRINQRNPGKPFVIDANWDDGWLFSGGVEYDYSQTYTVRAGLGFEKSPIQDPTQRLPQLPDSDRIWASVGLTMHYSVSTTFDLAFAHIFFDDAHIHRGALSNPNLILDADVSQDANIFSIGIKTRW